MKILLISDTHGSFGGLEKAMESHKEVDKIIHLGDFWQDGADLEDQWQREVLKIKGNGDWQVKRPLCHILQTEIGKIYLCHGHVEGVKNGLTNLYYQALEQGCIGAFFGHTHRAIFEKSEDFFFVNPGSFGIPAPGEKPSYAIVDISSQKENSISVKFVYPAPQRPR